MKNVTRHYGKLEMVQRLPSSLNGNPRFLCRLDGYTFKTSVDSMLGFTVQNLWGKECVATIGLHHNVLSLDSIELI